jgi:chromosome segregation ATPase
MKMRNDNDHEPTQFKMRLSDASQDEELAGVQEEVLARDIDELRMEKLNTRVTIISIIIPVLIVIVLVIAYLDIKKRVSQTEDTGAMSFQKVSGDLESRFSSLSIRIAQIEDSLKKLTDASNQTSARLEVKISKLDEAIKDARTKLAGKKETADSIAVLEKKVDTAATILDESKSSHQQLQGSVDQIRNSTSEQKNQLSGLEDKVSRLGREKIDKQAMDLAVRLENLKLEQNLRAQISALEERLRNLEKQSGARLPAPTSTPSNRPRPSGPEPVMPSAGQQQQLQEQNIAQ